MFKTNLNCECCNTEMRFAGISNSVYCPNNDCLLFDRCFGYDFIESRAEARKNNQVRTNKEPIRTIFR